MAVMPTYRNPYVQEEVTRAERAPSLTDPSDNPIARRLLATRASIAQGMPQTLPEFSAARNRISNQVGAQRQTTENALQRRFAAMGNLNSGEAAKQIALANQSFAEQQNQAEQDINAQEAQQLNQMREAETQRAFQQGVLDNDQALKEQQFGLERAKWTDQIDMARKEFERDNKIAAFNAATTAAESGDKDAFKRYLDAYFAMFTGKAGPGVSAGAPTVPMSGPPAGAVPAQIKQPFVSSSGGGYSGVGTGSRF